MNKFSLSIVMSLFFLLNLKGQIKDHTISIVGQGSQDIEYIGLKIPFTVKEIVPNEYRKIKYKSIISNLDDFKKSLMENGFKNIEFIKKPLTSDRYSSSAKENYEIILKNEEEAERVIDSNIEGITLGKIEYIYQDLPDDFNGKLIEAAIKDATRKANRVAKSIKKKIGKIISILDKSGFRRTKSLNKNKSKSTLNYSTNVTFELLDK